MKVEIRSRYSGVVLFSAEVGSLKLAVELAVKSRADLSGANLFGADLFGAKSVNKYLTTPLYGLFDQPGKIRAYKLITSTGEGPYNGGIRYTIGQQYEIADANTNEQEACAAGINVATLDWCLKQWKEGYRILIIEFTAQDIACIPIGSDGKFRLYRCAVVGEKARADVGLPPVASSLAEEQRT